MTSIPASQTDLETLLQERKALLPKVIQNAIDSADIAAGLRTLAQKHQLHVDLWQILENQVRLTLLGFEDSEDMALNIEKELKTSQEVAASLAHDINETIFEPIRQELERGLGSPQAKEAVVTPVEAVRQEVLSEARASGAIAATPPAAKPTEKAVRAVLSTTYAPLQPSHERKDIDGDPYREPVN